MRFYSFTNYYLSSIQIGIQTAHALGEMVIEYKNQSHKNTGYMLEEWLQHHKTIVCLNGGNSQDLRRLWILLNDLRNTDFPKVRFNEDEQSLDYALTCVAIVLPERLYAAEFKQYDKDINGHWQSPDGTWVSGWEEELLNVIKKLPLAR